ncbi:RidA family protein [Corynebacterium doosanense]|uniref:LysR family transcriptional regulator n=1 Tax=Corynebacterium doosanense CAU 212 = DSM 45436 TaxID=558173 RepID=A0A097IDC6_9CORY|nr:RidA family protein [Corynebacterium doosanense]AIT60125.1 LysR family transcriptional regulator [Corynebacterium doosanense CAU 212 = DSM 45436]
MTASARLAELGISLPAPVAPLGSYTAATVVGEQVWTSGQLPMVDGALPLTGAVGADVTPEQAQSLARTAALNALAAIDGAVGIDNVTRVLKLVVFVSSAPDFYGQPQVANGASDYMTEIFGDAGVHVRSAVGVAALPANSPVEIEVVVEVSGSHPEKLS